jgi:hypothetical protein
MILDRHESIQDNRIKYAAVSVLPRSDGSAHCGLATGVVGITGKIKICSLGFCGKLNFQHSFFLVFILHLLKTLIESGT